MAKVKVRKTDMKADGLTPSKRSAVVDRIRNEAEKKAEARTKEQEMKEEARRIAGSER